MKELMVSFFPMCFLSAECLRQEAPEVDAEVMAESSDRVAPEEEVGGVKRGG